MNRTKTTLINNYIKKVNHYLNGNHEDNPHTFKKYLTTTNDQNRFFVFKHGSQFSKSVFQKSEYQKNNPNPEEKAILAHINKAIKQRNEVTRLLKELVDNISADVIMAYSCLILCSGDSNIIDNMSLFVKNIKSLVISIAAKINEGSTYESRLKRESLRDASISKKIESGKNILKLDSDIIKQLIELKVTHQIAMSYFNIHYVDFLRLHLKRTTDLSQIVYACVVLEDKLASYKTTREWTELTITVNASQNKTDADPNITTTDNASQNTTDAGPNITTTVNDEQNTNDTDIQITLPITNFDNTKNANMLLKQLYSYVSNNFKYDTNDTNSDPYVILNRKFSDMGYNPCHKKGDPGWIVRRQSYGNMIGRAMGNAAFAVALVPLSPFIIFSSAGGGYQNVTRHKKIKHLNLTKRVSFKRKFKKNPSFKCNKSMVRFTNRKTMRARKNK